METLKQACDRTITNLSDEINKLKDFIWNFEDSSKGKTRIYLDSKDIHKIYQSVEELSFEIERLDSFNKQLYANRGKGSQLKKVSSRKNGIFGGRPPKEITEKKKRIAELEYKLYQIGESLTDEEIKERDELYLDITVWEDQKKRKIQGEIENQNI